MYDTLGGALFAYGFAKTIWVNKDNVAKRDVGEFDPAVRLNPNGIWSARDFESRYGTGSWFRKGDLVGERYAADIVETVVRHETNPLAIKSNRSYVLTEQDKVDVKMVKGIGNAAVYDSYFVVKERQLVTPVVPPIAPPVPIPPKPVKPPVVPAPPPPIDPPLEHLHFWLGLPFDRAADIVTNNVNRAREAFKGKSAAFVADLIIKQATMAWREIKRS
jgi:hypothetical protein